MSYFKHVRRQAEIAAALVITSLEQLRNTPITGDEKTDTEIVDAAFEFIADESTSMSDKIDALKYLAPIFGEDPSIVNEAYVLDMLDDSEDASAGKSKIKKRFANRK